MSSASAAQFSLRRAVPGEGESILPCFEWLFIPPGAPPSSAWSPEAGLKRIEAALRDQEAAIFVAERIEPDASAEDGDSPIIGICSVYLDIESVRHGLRAWVEDLAVSEQSRSGGVGAALLRAAREWGRERGATHLELDSGIRRTDAHRFYERERPAWTGIQYAWQL